MFANDGDALNYFQFAGISGCVVTFFAAPLIGKMIDRWSAKGVVPGIFFFKALVNLGFFFIPSPKMAIWSLLVPFCAVGQHASMMAALSYQQPMYPNDIRGILSSV